jgi:hypothetical protein
MSNIPAIVTGILIGTALSQAAGEKMCITIFSLFGINHVDFNIPFIWMAITMAGVIAVAIIASGVSGLKVRGLKPVEMIAEE